MLTHSGEVTIATAGHVRPSLERLVIDLLIINGFSFSCFATYPYILLVGFRPTLSSDVFFHNWSTVSGFTSKNAPPRLLPSLPVWIMYVHVCVFDDYSCFTDQIDLSGLPIDVALRKFQSYFRMPVRRCTFSLFSLLLFLTCILNC